MPVRGEEVASSIDAQVRDSIEKMVGEIRSSIEDVRIAVDQQLKAALQSVQADVNSITFLPQIRKSVTELEESIVAEIPPPVAAPALRGAARAARAAERARREARAAAGPAPVAAPACGGGARVKGAVQAIERGKSQVDVLNTLLEQCLE